MRVLRVAGVAVVVAVFVVAFAMPLYQGLGRLDLENDEAIHSVVTESILETGDWMTPRSSPLEGSDFVEKPPLKFWLVALPMRLGLLPDNEFGLRFWDATFGAVAFAYVFAIGYRMAGLLCGLISVLVLFTFEPLLLSHGFRTNNMDAAQVLAYCGGMYHFLRWDAVAGQRAGPWHAVAVGLYCFLRLMTKFVAIAFLPMVMVAVLLMTPGGISKLLRHWRLWSLVAGLVLVAAAPWFLYQWNRMGARFWYIILGEHVFKRFSGFLDPAHVHPWNYYFVQIHADLERAGTFWLVAAGAVLVLVRMVRKPWIEGLVVVFWCALPLALISLGTSKLVHYAYPFIPPLALAGGYLFATLEQTTRGALVRATAGRGSWAFRAALPAVLLLTIAPIQAYRSVRQDLMVNWHPLRSARDCIVNVRDYELNSARTPPNIFVWLPTGFYQHTYYYYFRKAGWERHDYWHDEGLRETLDEPGRQRAVLMPDQYSRAFFARTHRDEVSVPRVDLGNVVLLLPGPFTGCASK